MLSPWRRHEMDRRAAVSRQVRSVQVSLHSLDHALRLLTLLLTAATENGRKPRSGIARQSRISRKERASLVLQGRYMGYMRHLKPRQKAQFRRSGARRV